MNMKKWVFGFGVIMLLGACTHQGTSVHESSSAQETVKVSVQKVAQMVPDTTLEYSGTVVPKVTVPLSFKNMGTVLELRVDEGDFVRKNQVLAILDKSTFESAYKAALATQKQAQDAYERMKKVYEKGSLPEIQWKEVLARVAQANSASEIVKENLENCTLRAPSSGIIGTRNLEVGANTAPGVAVFNLMDIQEVYVKISVPENEIGKIEKGQHAQIVIPALGNRSLEATVQKIGVSANAISKTYEVKLLMKNPELIVKPGMVCDVNLNIGWQKKVLVAPYSAILKEGSKSYVFVYDAGSQTVHQREVKTGAFVANQIEIISGLTPEDVVVTSGHYKLHEGARVRI